MKLKTHIQKTKSAARIWKKQYFYNGQWSTGFTFDPQEIHKRLLSAKSKNEIERIIGNKSWTRPWCEEHMDYCEVVIVLGKGDTFSICKSCLEKALKLAQTAS